MASKYGKHLTFDDRTKIEDALSNGSSRTAIAETLGKDKSTICKEVKKHRELVTKEYGRSSTGVYDCKYAKECGCTKSNLFCINPCDKYERERCSRRDRTVGVCNGCEDKKDCRRTKYLYNSFRAHKSYLEELKDSREGIDLSTSEAKMLGDILKPLVDKGQSIYVILKNHPEIPYSEKTIYNYIDNGVFSQNGLYNIDLHLKPGRKPTKKKKGVTSKPRESRAYLKGRTYNDYLEFMSLHPNAKVVEMDTLYNDVTNGPFMQTFQLVELKVMVAILHNQKTAATMLSGVRQLKERMGDNYFKKHVQVILTDRGSEFSAAKEIESLGVKVFYCDPMAAHQKPHVENNHLLLRRVLPKEKDLVKLGLDSQDKLDLIFSHINNYPREELHGKSPVELLLFYHNNDMTILHKLQIQKIDQDSVTLKPSLLKQDK